MTSSASAVDHPIAVAAAALLTGIAVVMFNSIPIVLGAAAETFQLDTQQLGTVASTYFAGHTLATLSALAWVRRFDWRRISFLAAAGGAIGYFAAALTGGLQPLLALLFIIGIFGGTIYVVAMTCLADGSDPARNFGWGFLCQLMLGALVVFIYPTTVIPQWGLSGVLVSFGVLFAAGLGLAFWLPASGSQASKASESTGKFQLLPVTALLGLIVFFVGATAIWPFLERMGDSAGLAADFIGTVLAVSLFAGGAASLLTVLVSNRYGLRLPITCGGIMIILSLAVLALEVTSMRYAIAALLFQFAWVLAVNYMAAVIADTDASGRHGPLIPAALGVASVIGPFAAGLLLSQSLPPLLLLTLVTTITSVSVFFWVTSKQTVKPSVVMPT